MTEQIVRRPISARDTRWAAATAGWLARRGIRPNTISVMSVVFAAGAGACLVGLGHSQSLLARVLLPLSAALCIQLRLLCNLFDGMVAVEQQQRTKSGEIFNELPDRFADAFILAGAGYAATEPVWLIEMGWTAAVLALITAYVRSLGAAVGAGQYFLGPMAKQHRMALMTGLCVLLAMTAIWPQRWILVAVGLGLISIGCLITIGRRAVRIVRELESR